MNIIRKLKIVILSFVLVAFSNPINIDAANANVSISAPTQVYVGESFNITVSYSANEDAMWVVNSSSSSGLSVGSFKDLSPEVKSGDSITKSATISSAGKHSFSVDVGESYTYMSEEKLSGGASISIEAINRSEEKPAPAPEKPTTPQVDNIEKEKEESQAPQETEAEKAERLEREKKEEEERKKAEIEEAKKVPLVSSFDIISASDKLNGEVLKTIETESEKFDYEYTLPRRIDAFKLDLKSDATLDYVKDHKFADGENEKKIVVKAHNDDFEQTINILIKRNTDAFVERKVGDKSLAVYEDELLDALMKEKGFERKTFKEGDQEVSYFSKGKVNMQLLVDDENNAQWHLLNDKNEAVKPLAMVLDKDGNVLFILEANEEMRKETLHGNKYETKSRDLGKEFANIDKELKIENKYGAWEFADGEIVWAMNENLEEGLYHIANDGTIKAAVVAFDQVDEKMKNIALGTSIALAGLIAANIAYFVVSKTKKDEVI